MNLSVDFVERFEQAKEAFKHSITQQVDLWFAPLLAELKAAKAYQHHFDPSHLLLPDNRRELNGSSTRNTSRVDLNVSGCRQQNSEAPPPPAASSENANAHSQTSGTRTNQISLQNTSQTIPRSVLNISQALSQPGTSKSLRTFFKQEDNENDTPQQQQLLDNNSSDAQLDENDLLNCDCADCTEGHKEDQDAVDDNQSDLSISVEDEDEGGRRPPKKRRLSPAMIPNASSAESDSHGPDFAALAAQILYASEATAGSGGSGAGAGGTQPPKRSRRPYVKAPPAELNVHCPVTGCSRAFRKQSELTVHLWVHRGIRPFLCRWDGCDQKFTQRSNGISHIRKIHLKLPSLLKDQIELGIVDNRDPADWLEINPECR